jgi:ATP-dependent helicase/nuclease subunit A
MNAPPIDQAARQRAISAAGSVLVQAPAGSGKTTLLAQRYLRLLAGVEAPEQILALTFTRRAAQEMRERVMGALQAATASICPEAMHPQTWRLGVAAREHMISLGLDIERHPSRLRIETIDAFNAWLAGQLPITAGTGARMSLTDAPQPLYREAARRALSYDSPDPFGHAVEQLLALDDQRWHGLVELISGMLPSRDRWLRLLAGRLHAASALEETQLQAVRRHLDEDLALLVARTLATAHEAIGRERLAVLSRLMHTAAQRLPDPLSPPSAWAVDEAAPRPVVADFARWRAVARLLLTDSGGYRKRFTTSCGFPQRSPDKALMLDLVAELERDPWVLQSLRDIRVLPEPAYDDAQWSRVREVAQVLVLAAAQLEQVFRERGAADFPAVSLAALRALGTPMAPTDLTLRLDYRLQHILIDEFQDTSSAQLDLVKLLTAGWQHGDGRSVFCVGDPMQSIYGFRQAEVRAFLQLAEEGIGDLRFEVARLRSNFRSAKPLVDWINACFSRILPRLDDRERGAIAFRPSESMLTTAGAAAVVLKGFPTRRVEAQAIAQMIDEQAAQHPDWRIVVLVRARSHAREIAAAMRAQAIQFRAVDIEALKERPVVRDLVATVCALLHFGDRVAWLALLRAPWVGLRLADLLIVSRGAPTLWEALINVAVLVQLSEDGRRRCRRVRELLEAAFRLRSHGSLTRWVERTWIALGGPTGAADAEDLEHVNAVFARLRELEERGLPDAAELAANFDDLYVESRTAAAVEIMTIHKSKGLEFDMVIVPALDRPIPHNSEPLLLSHDFARADRDGLVMASRPGVGEEGDALFEFLRHQARDAAGLEADRLLYVACTRAKWRLVLTATVQEGREPDARAAWRPHAGSLLAALWPVVGAEFGIEPPIAPPAQDGQEAAPVLRGGPLRRVPPGWSPDLDAVLGAAAEFADAPVTRVDTPVFDWAGETARRVGSLVHAELQILDLDAGSEAAITAREPRYRLWLARHGVPAERLADASRRVMAALLAVRRDSRGRWILQKGYREDLREYALSGYYRGELVRVVFDRSFIDQDGVRWVIDYKTSEHSGGNREQFLDQEVERYRPQLHRYAALAAKLGSEVIRMGLYFPLMRAWREWAP